MREYELAQLNIALMNAPLEDPVMTDFVENLDRINELAERSPGYVWRLQAEEGNATVMRPFGEEYLVNLSVWNDIESLHFYVYKSVHAEIMSRRREWFQRMREVYTVLWWVEAGHRPTIEEARAKLEQLKRAGPSPDAFTFKKPFPAPGAAKRGRVPGFDDRCLAL